MEASTSAAVQHEAAPTMVGITLSTKDNQYGIPPARYQIPADWRRFQLSELINKVLDHTAQPVPFDFLVQGSGQLLRTSLQDYLNSQKLTTESILELEYFQSVLPPKHAATLPTQDWVNDVQIKGDTYLSACYDGSVSLFTSSVTAPTTIQTSSLPTLSACFVQDRIASAGMDRIIRIHSSINADAKVQYSLATHTGPISSVRSSKGKILSASWDGLVALWTLDEAYKTDSVIEERGKKRRKKALVGEGITLGPSQVMRGHKDTVSKAIFDRTEEGKAYSVGQDHTVRTWDLETGVQSDLRNSDKVLLDVDQMASANLLVTGATDRTVCFWDFRQETNAISLTLRGHASQVSSVKAHPTSPLLVVSASFDSTLRIWDARSPKQALFVIQREASAASKGVTDEKERHLLRLKGPEKALCVDWDGELVVSGGEEKTLQLHRAKV